jgi:hypothetical protein
LQKICRLSLTKETFHHFCKLSLWLRIDPYLVLSPAGGGAPGYEYWVQPFDKSSMVFLQPLRCAI